MSIKEDDFKELISVNADIEKISTISSDSKNLLTRIPLEVRDFLEIKKGDKIRWLVKSDSKELKIELIKK